MNTGRTYSFLVPMVRPLVKGRVGADRRRHFDAVGIAKGRVLFLGDSITEGAMWPDLFPDLATSNRGIGGEATYDLLERVDAVINDPAVVCLMIGTNDLHGPRELRAPAKVVERTDEIVRRIREAAPSALILVNSVLPRTVHFASRIREINDGLPDGRRAARRGVRRPVAGLRRRQRGGHQARVLEGQSPPHPRGLPGVGRRAATAPGAVRDPPRA